MDETNNKTNGTICDAAAWNVALTSEEVVALVRGAHPLLIRPAALIFYAPFVLARTS